MKQIVSSQILLNEILISPFPIQSFQHHQNLVDSRDLADFFIDIAFSLCSIKFLTEEFWLQNQEDTGSEISFRELISQSFQNELFPIHFLHSFFKTRSLKDFRGLNKLFLQLRADVIDEIKSRPLPEQKIFAKKSLDRIMEIYEFESLLIEEKARYCLHSSLDLYSAFDTLDLLFELNYDQDKFTTHQSQSSERLYEGSGVGVQTGYSSIFKTLKKLNPSKSSRFIDLGSGYGRLGFILGLLRPDIDFKGYEYIKHRVKASNRTCHKYGLESHVQFIAQDLAQKDFQIPIADFYYLYDPFTEETYHHVLKQLVDISHSQNICIMTKGNAKIWVHNIAHIESWPGPVELEGGNICLFFSR
jgi:hypothetical protein